MKTKTVKPKYRRTHGQDSHQPGPSVVWPAWFKRMGKKLARVRWLE